MICEQCKAHIDRAVVGARGNMINCLAYGCDNHMYNGHVCTREQIVRYMIDEYVRPMIKREKDNIAITREE